MRVLVVTPWYPRAGDGAGSFVRDQVRTVARDHEPVVLHLVSGHGAAGVSDDDGVHVVRVRVPLPSLPGTATLRDLLGAAAGTLRFRRRGFKPDLVHAHVYSAGLAAVPVARALGRPLVLSEHYSGVGRRALGRPSRRAAATAYRTADLVCPVSASLAGAVSALCPRARVRVIPNAVDERLFRPPDLPRREGPLRVVTVGSLVPVKGVPTLLESLALVAARRRDVRLAIVGDGPLRADCERRVDALGLRDLVEFRGRRSRAEVAAALREADLLAVPSRWETFSVATAEALSSGLPVLATRVGALPELVDPASGMLVAPGDAHALARGLERMLETARGHDRAAIAARAAERFGRPAVGKAWDQVYRGLASE